MISNKKAVSQVVTYVLLIVTAISLSVVVFAFLQGIVPEEQESCPEGLSIVIKEAECAGTDQIYISFQNKGRFSIDGVYARYSGDEDGAAGGTLVPIGDSGGDGKRINQITIDQAEEGFMYFGEILKNPRPLTPNSDPYKQLFEYSIISGDPSNLGKIEIQPFLSEGNNLIICEDKVVSYKIPCS